MDALAWSAHALLLLPVDASWRSHAGKATAASASDGATLPFVGVGVLTFVGEGVVAELVGSTASSVCFPKAAAPIIDWVTSKTGAALAGLDAECVWRSQLHLDKNIR